MDSSTKIINKDLDNFIYVPSINLYIAKKTSHKVNWFNVHKLLQKDKERMLTIPEFIEFLNYIKSSNNQEHLKIYKEITEVRLPWRAEWLDADFKIKNNKLHINYNHVLDSNGNLVPKNSEILEENTLMKDKRISLDDYLNNNHTLQGLPTKNVELGNLYYQHPRSENNLATRFDVDANGAGFFYKAVPFGRHPYLGVRAVKENKKQEVF